MDKCEIAKNLLLIPVLIECPAAERFVALQQVTGTPIIYLFPATGENPVDAASVVLNEKVQEVLPGSVVLRGEHDII
jgi:hypothetical protein